MQNNDNNQLIISQQREGGLISLNRDAEMLVERFLAEADVAPTTRDTYRKALTQFLRWHHSQGSGELARADILAYKQHQLARVQAGTVATYLSAVRALFSWLGAAGLGPDLAAGVKGVRLSKEHRKDALTPEQLRRVLEAARGDDLISKRNFAIINLMARVGVRGIELERANVEDLRNKGAATVLHVMGKGRVAKDSFVVLTPAAVGPIYDYLSARRASGLEALGPHSPLFASHSTRTYGKRLVTRSLREVVKNSLRAAGLDSPRWTTHSLRHSAVTYALQGGASIQQAQAMARHGSVTTTMIYAHGLERINQAAEHAVADILGDI